MPRPRLALAACLLLCLLCSACAKKGAPPVYTGPPCRDVLTMPQDLAVYAAIAGQDRLLATPAEQAEAAEKQREALFRPWRLTSASPWVGRSLADNFSLKPDKAFAEDNRPFPPALWNALVDNSDKAAYPSRQGPAISLRHSDLRAMPTSGRYYRNPALPGEGYPFDYFQHTSLPVGTPLYICHVSKDGLWLLVESPTTAGWLPAADVAPVDEAFMALWQSRPLAALVRDAVPLDDGPAHIGALLPLAVDAPEGRGQALTVYVPARGPGGTALMRERALPPDAAARVPLPLRPREAALVGQGMLGQAYGWGGLDHKRDCSALTRDLFAPFGIFLPRNSAAQSASGRPISLAGLSGPEKEGVIRERGLPFASLLWMPGHIGVYIGQYGGKAVMFHNMWGLRLRDAEGGCAGRAVVGKAAVTSLRAGVERPDLCSPNSFEDTMERLTLLP